MRPTFENIKMINKNVNFNYQNIKINLRLKYLKLILNF